MENLDLEESLGHSNEESSRNFDNHTVVDFTTQSGGVSDSDEGTRRSEGRHTNNIHQMCVIITEVAEDDDGRNNTVANVQGDNPGNNHGEEREKIYVSTGEWRMIMSAIYQGTGIPTDSRREIVMGYHYALHMHKKKLLQEKSELRRSHESNSASSRPQWEEYSSTSESSEERHREPKHNRRRKEWPSKEGHTENLNSFLTADAGREYYARHARGSPGSSTSIPANHAAITRRSTGEHAPSRYKSL
jgi:hypothetical protein